MAGLGTLSKMAFRIESDQGMVNATYPADASEADAEEVLLKSSDQVPFGSENVEQDQQYELDETLLGTPGIINMDRVGLLAGGAADIMGNYDAIDALIACAMGFEKGAASDSPTYENGTALTAAAGITASTWDDAATPFVAGDVGKFIRVTNGTGEGQVRRISVFNSTSNVTVTPNWDVTPASTNTAEMAQEFEHLYELGKQLQDELWTNEWSSYPTGGVGTANDKILRRGTLGILKQSAIPWIWRSVMVNSMTISFEAKTGLKVNFDLVPFDYTRASTTNTTGTASDWDYDNASALFTPSQNERIIFPHLGGNGFLRIAPFADGAMDSNDEYGIMSFSVTLNNNLKSDDQDSLSTPYRIQPARGGFREITGQFVIPRYANDTFADWSDNETIMQSHIKFVGSTIATSARSYEIFLSSLKLHKKSIPTSGPEPLTQTYDFTGLIPASAPTFIGSGNPTQTITAPRSELMIRSLNQNPFNMFRDQNKEY